MGKQPPTSTLTRACPTPASISRGTEYQVYDTMTVTDPSIDVCSCGVNPDTCLGVEVAQHVSLADGHSQVRAPQCAAVRGATANPRHVAEQVTVVACLGHGSTVTATFVAQGFGSACASQLVACALGALRVRAHHRTASPPRVQLRHRQLLKVPPVPRRCLGTSWRGTLAAWTPALKVRRALCLAAQCLGR